MKKGRKQSESSSEDIESNQEVSLDKESQEDADSFYQEKKPSKNTKAPSKSQSKKAAKPLAAKKKIVKKKTTQKIKQTEAKKQKLNKKTTKEASDGSESEDQDLKDTFKLYQKKETPPSDDPGRIYYETLLRQRPDSIMAIKYCLEYGVIDDINEIKRLGKLIDKNKEKERDRLKK